MSREGLQNNETVSYKLSDVFVYAKDSAVSFVAYSYNTPIVLATSSIILGMAMRSVPTSYLLTAVGGAGVLAAKVAYDVYSDESHDFGSAISKNYDNVTSYMSGWEDYLSGAGLFFVLKFMSTFPIFSVTAIAAGAGAKFAYDVVQEDNHSIKNVLVSYAKNISSFNMNIASEEIVGCAVPWIAKSLLAASGYGGTFVKVLAGLSIGPFAGKFIYDFYKDPEHDAGRIIESYRNKTTLILDKLDQLMGEAQCTEQGHCELDTQ